jgi:long-chain fatty acid transport protein
MKNKNMAVLLSLSLCAVFPMQAYATNGLFGHAYGSRQGGIAGSGVAFPQDSLIASINPAGVVHLDKSVELDVQYFRPIRDYTVTASQFSGGFPPFPGGTVESGSESFFIPSIGLNWPLANDDAIGLALYGNGGMNTDYSASDTPFGFGTFGAAAVPGADADAGVDYAQLFVNLSYSKKFGNNHSWGVSALLNYSEIEFTGLAGFGAFSLAPRNLSDGGKDSDTGVGFRLGTQFTLSETMTLAAAYQSEISNRFETYSGVFPEAGKLHIPATAQIGLATRLASGTLTTDIQHIFYSDTEGVGRPGTTGLTSGCLPSAPFTMNASAGGPNCLGGNPGVGFGWDDMTVFKIGYTSAMTKNGWTWRVGASLGDQPVQAKDVTFNILAPGVIEQHFTMGFSKELTSGKELSGALMYAPESCVDGPDLFTPGQRVELCMKQIALNLGISF